jgi:hypothetical protein
MLVFKLNKTSSKNKTKSVNDKQSQKRFIKQRNVTKLTIILIGERVLSFSSRFF